MSEQGLQSYSAASGSDVDSYFPHPLLQQRLDLLDYLVQCSDIVISVVGPRGIGKTKLLHQLLKRAKPNWQVCALQAEGIMQAAPLLEGIFEGYGLQPGTDSVAFQDFLSELDHSGQIAVLIIDDAHELSDECLAAVGNLMGNDESEATALRIIFFAEPEIHERLARIGPYQHSRTLQRLDLPRYSLEETADYIEHQLGSGMTVSKEQVRHVYHLSEGLPAAINAAISKVIRVEEDTSDAPAPVIQETDEDVVVEVRSPSGKVKEKQGLKARFTSDKFKKMAIAIPIALLLVIILLFQSKINEWFGIERAEKEKVEVVELALPETPAKVVIRQTEDQKIGSSIKPVEMGEPVEMQHAAPEESVPSVSEKDTAVLEAPELPESPFETRAQSDAADELDVATALTPEAMIEPGVPASVVDAGSEDTVEEVETESVETGSESSVAEASPPDEAVEENLPEEGAVPAVQNPEWLLAQNESAYVIQLFGTREKSMIDKFVAEHGLQGKVAYMHTLFQGKDWYTLLYGVFPDRASALAGVKELPAAVQKNSLWVRSMASVHQDINKLKNNINQ